MSKASPAKSRAALALAVASACALAGPRSVLAEKMQVGFLWHMHQPIYYPGENILQTDANNRFSFSVTDVHNQRFGPYTTWPRDAIQTGGGLPNLGAQVSFSGSLIENLNNLQSAGVNGGMWNNWKSGYQQARAMNTSLGNTRLDLVGFSYHHALMPLLDERDMRMQIRMHKQSIQQQFGSTVPYSRGFFPAETAFSERMIPVLQSEGFDWALVDNIHFDRATKNYPHTNASGLFAPNRADQINPDPVQSGGAWVQLNNLWAPSKVSAPFSYRPHNVQHVDPNTGAVSKIVAVPGARYEGNEDGRGGFGALQYQSVMDQYRQYNTDPAHPMFVMLHHDGDNYGGGSDAYYHHNFQQMVNWANGNANYNVSTVADYLQRFPVAANDVIHVENGSWAGADNGDAEFKKWLGDPNGTGWSPDRNSWAVLTAAKNRVYTAEDILPITSVNNVINKTGNNSEKAWHYLVQGQASDHWYWDGTEVWDSNVTRASNLAVSHADQVINGYTGVEQTKPSVFVPQRDAYNPGNLEFGTTPEAADFRVWTFAYDVSGLTSVTLKWRTDIDGENPLASTQNETYAGGGEVGAWNSLPMTASDVAPPGNILSPTYRAMQYAAMINGQRNALVDYYVEAIDANGNITRTDIQHVWVGGTTAPPVGNFVMDGQLDADVTEVAANGGMKLHFARKGAKIYLATNDAGEGSDHFIYFARTPGALVNANWAKAGQIAQWDAYLADENNNDWEGWFDAQGSTAAATGANGGVLEGTLDLLGEYGFVPSELYLAVGVYGTNDAAPLVFSVPPSVDGNGNINANEYLRLSIAQGWVGVGASPNWTTSQNWTDGTVPNAVGAHARFLDSNLGGSFSVNVSAPVVVGQMTFDNLTSYALAGGGGTITLDTTTGAGALTVVRGSHSITAPVAVSDNVVVDVQRAQDALSVTNLQPTAATITKHGPGTLAVNVLRSGGLTVSAGSVVVLANGTSASASRVGALSLGGSPGSPAGTLDLSDNDLIVGGSSYAAVAALIAHARNLGAWDQAGITSSHALSNALHSTTLGVMSGADYLSIAGGTFSDMVVASSDVLVKYTYYGDADFSGLIDFDDYVRIDAGINGSLGGWVNGDFDLSGGIDFDDYVLIDLAFNAQSSTLRRAMSFLDGSDRSTRDMRHPSLRAVVQHFGAFGTDYASHFLAAVPEPAAALGVVASTFAPLVRPARRRIRRRLVPPS